MRKQVLVLVCSFFFSFYHSAAQNNTRNPVSNNGIERPKLVIGLVVDQMRWDYLYRYFDRYGDAGFKRLLQKGYSFENAFIPYTPAVTASGHSCLYTGSVPSIHGIVGNDWIERDHGDPMYCVEDRSVHTVGSFSNQGQMSPKNLLTTTIGDELRLATNFKSRVFGIAIKDRGGILPAGHSANAAYWFDDSTGNWITSTYYMNQLPQWVNSYNGLHKPDAMMKEDWNLLYDRSVYDQSTDDNKTFEKPLDHETKKDFPHTYKALIGKNYYGFRASPYGNTLSIDFAEELILNEKLGMSGQADMLCVSLSSTDYIGHRFGPNSVETEDTYLRLDKDIANFLNFLDKTIGENNYLLFLSADHGVPQIPGFSKENKIPAGNIRAVDLIKEMDQLCLKEFGAAGLVQHIYEYQLYLDHKKIDSLKLDIGKVKKLLLNYLLSRPEVVNAFDYENFDKLIMPQEEKEMFAKGYFYKRSGDIQFILKPQYIDGADIGTEHGAWYTYDSHIPLLWYGWRISHGRTNRQVYMTDVAPTIAAMLQVQMPNGCIGKVLEELTK